MSRRIDHAHKQYGYMRAQRAPVEMCYLGWQESLVQFATLVEPEIPG